MPDGPEKKRRMKQLKAQSREKLGVARKVERQNTVVGKALSALRVCEREVKATKVTMLFQKSSRRGASDAKTTDSSVDTESSGDGELCARMNDMTIERM